MFILIFSSDVHSVFYCVPECARKVESKTTLAKSQGTKCLAKIKDANIV